MRHSVRILALAAIVLLEGTDSARAGMPMALLSDVARMRVQTISFFLGCFLIGSWGVRRIWNAARRDFPRLPYLSYPRATGLVALWGLLFLLVLTMISGARELMTPGAWTKHGLTYRLAEQVTTATPDAIPHERERRRSLDRLRAALWTYARHHEGHFPTSATPPEVPEDVWDLPDPSGLHYVYVPGLVADRGDSLLAYEPGLYGKDRFALRTSGAIVRINEEDLPSPPAGRESP